jgi:hypothetical protein
VQEFWEYLDKVGMMHVGQGRAHPLHVEYVHIGVTLSFVQDVLTEAILSHPRLKMDKKIALVKALSKVIWIQNDLFAKWYVRDGEEYADERLVPEIEPEGYLHGKKVIHDGSESESDIEDTPVTHCPFSGLSSPRLVAPRPTNGISRTGSDEKACPASGAPRRDSASPTPRTPLTPASPARQTFASTAIPRPVSSSGST